MTAKLYNWCIHVILLLLENNDIDIQVVFELLYYNRPIFHLRMQQNRLAPWLGSRRGPRESESRRGTARKEGKEGGWMDAPIFETCLRPWSIMTEMVNI